MYDDDSSSHSSSYVGYHSYGGSRWGGYSPPQTPPRAEPVVEYELKYEESGMGAGRKCM